MIPFRKMQGLGNDFVVFDAREKAVPITSARARAIADRHFGVGCDTLVLITPGNERADAVLRFFNADGGEVESCGNATRCIARLLMDESGRPEIRLDSKGGFLVCRDAGKGLVTVDLGVPGGGAVSLPALVEIVLAVALLSFTAMMLGLLVSAVVRKEEVTMPLLVLLAIVQVVFCGALLKLNGVPGLQQLSWLVPARWALGAMAGTIDLHRIVPSTLTADPLFRHSAAVWLLDMGMLVVLPVLLGAAVARLLRRHEPVIMRA